MTKTKTSSSSTAAANDHYQLSSRSLLALQQRAFVRRNMKRDAWSSKFRVFLTPKSQNLQQHLPFKAPSTNSSSSSSLTPLTELSLTDISNMDVAETNSDSDDSFLSSSDLQPYLHPEQPNRRRYHRRGSKSPSMLLNLQQRLGVIRKGHINEIVVTLPAIPSLPPMLDSSTKADAIHKVPALYPRPVSGTPKMEALLSPQSSNAEI